MLKLYDCYYFNRLKKLLYFLEEENTTLLIVDTDMTIQMQIKLPKG